MVAYGIHNARIRQEDGSIKSWKGSFKEMKRKQLPRGNMPEINKFENPLG
jgi:hypothetical protein